MRLPRMTYANVTSTVALLVALGGGTAIAVDKLNADRVDGLHAAKLDFVAKAKGPGTKFKRVFNQGGLVIRARCFEQSGHFIEAKAKSKRENAHIQVGAISDLSGPQADFALDRDFDRADTVELPVGFADQGVHTLVYSTRQGSHVALTFQSDVGAILGQSGEADCLLGGAALHSP